MDLSSVPASVFGSSTKVYRDNFSAEDPDKLCLEFYAMNHCFSVLRKNYTPNQPLPPVEAGLVSTYFDVLSKHTQRMLHYLVAIIVREARHARGSEESPFWVKMKDQFSEPVVTFLQNNRAVDELVAVSNFQNHPPDCKMGEFVQAISYLFHKGSFGSSYGGHPWGNIADCLLGFISGKTSLETMLDTAWTLAHNGGPIFNKGMVFGGYSGALYYYLDVQRSGQIPQLLMDDSDYSGALNVKKTPKLKSFMGDFLSIYPDEFGKYVDWTLVEQTSTKSGNVNYAYLRKMQKSNKNFPGSTEFVFLGEQKCKVVGEFAVFPGQVIQKVERVK